MTSHPVEADPDPWLRDSQVPRLWVAYTWQRARLHTGPGLTALWMPVCTGNSAATSCARYLSERGRPNLVFFLPPPETYPRPPACIDGVLICPPSMQAMLRTSIRFIFTSHPDGSLANSLEALRAGKGSLDVHTSRSQVLPLLRGNAQNAEGTKRDALSAACRNGVSSPCPPPGSAC